MTRPLYMLALLCVAITATVLPCGAAADVITQAALAPADSDGHRTIAWFERPGILRVRDAASGTSFDVDVTPGCATPQQSTIAVGGGKVLYGCDVDHATQYGVYLRSEPRMLDVATRTIQVPAGAVRILDEYESLPMGSSGFSDVGAYGLRYSGSGYHTEYSTGSLDWRTGAAMAGDGTESSVPDLDSATLLTTLCEPLHQSSYDKRGENFFGGPEFDPFLYEEPFGVLRGPRTSLSIQRCGSERKRVLWPWHRGRPRAEAIELAAGFVTWFVGDGPDRALYAYLPECALRLAWHPSVLAQAEHVDGAIVLSEAYSGTGRWTVRSIPLAGACQRLRDATAAVVGAGRQTRSALLRSASLLDRPTGATAVPSVPQRTTLARLPLRAGAAVTLKLHAPARSVRWRLGRGLWHAAAGGGRSWSLRAPRSYASRLLSFAVRPQRGGSMTLAVRVPATMGR